jgi:hypothetical protein
MTKEEFVAAIAAKRTEEYVEEVLEDMSENDLYCNFVSGTMNGSERYTVSEGGDLVESTF